MICPVPIRPRVRSVCPLLNHVDHKIQSSKRFVTSSEGVEVPGNLLGFQAKKINHPCQRRRLGHTVTCPHSRVQQILEFPRSRLMEGMGNSKIGHRHHQTPPLPQSRSGMTFLWHGQAQIHSKPHPQECFSIIVVSFAKMRLMGGMNFQQPPAVCKGQKQPSPTKLPRLKMSNVGTDHPGCTVQEVQA